MQNSELFEIAILYWDQFGQTEEKRDIRFVFWFGFKKKSSNEVKLLGMRNIN